MKKIKDFIVNNKLFFILAASLIGGAAIGIIASKAFYGSNRNIGEIASKTDSSYQKIYYDTKISSLKKQNKELYDSIKSFKKDVSYVVQFRYKKQYKIDTVWVSKNGESDSIKYNTYYYNGSNDTLSYELAVRSSSEPLWYSMNFKTSDKITILNKKVGDTNELSIKGQGKSDISDVTSFSKKETKSIFSKFNIGPSITAGYDVVNNAFGVMAGLSMIYSIW